jgi:hypothetical protein
MTKKSRQAQIESEKTVSLKVTGLKKLQFEILEPNNGVIDIVNTLDNGRVCSLRIEDFDSLGDAKAYAEVIKLAPDLLALYLPTAKNLEQVIGRMENKTEKGK